MKKTTRIHFLAILCITNCLLVFAQPPGSGWQMKFNENFNGNNLNTNLWQVRSDSQFNRGNITIRNGLLEIRNVYGNTGTPNGAWIQSKQTFRYGYYEARLRHQSKTRHIWPTWWVWGGNDGGTKDTSEFDVCEWNHFNDNQGRGINQSHHYKGDNNSIQVYTSTEPTEWHTYGLLWTPTEATFYIDGRRMFSSDRPRTANDFLNLILSSSPNKLDLPRRGTNLPTFFVDYVRVWQNGNPGNTNPGVPYGQVIALKAQVNNKYVSAENGGNSPLIANRTSIGPWERFRVVNPGQGFVALQSLANNRFVTAEDNGRKPAIARGTGTPGTWQKFIWQQNGDGTFSLLSHANSQYLTAENAGNSPLISARTRIGRWEKFTWTASGGKTFDIQDTDTSIQIISDPISGTQNFKVIGLSEEAPTTVTLYDITGKQVQVWNHIRSTQADIQINATTAEGIYIVAVSNGATVVKRKLIL